MGRGEGAVCRATIGGQRWRMKMSDKCDICGKEVKTRQGLYGHKRLAHPKRFEVPESALAFCDGKGGFNIVRSQRLPIYEGLEVRIELCQSI